MNYVYHGSKIKNLKIINKTKSTHQKEWVYATKSKVLSAVFISDGGSDLNYFLGGIGTKDSPIVLVERKAGMFDQIFNLSGSIYMLNAKNFKNEKTGWDAEVVSDKDEKIIDEETVDNVLKYLEKSSLNGEIELYRYPNRPKYIPIDNSDLIPKVINWYKKGFDISMFLNIYPELKQKFYKHLEKDEQTII